MVFDGHEDPVQRYPKQVGEFFSFKERADGRQIDDGSNARNQGTPGLEEDSQ